MFEGLPVELNSYLCDALATGAEQSAQGGNFDRARSLFQRAVIVAEAALGFDAPKTADLKNALKSLKP
jgi:hypothetical protein